MQAFFFSKSARNTKLPWLLLLKLPETLLLFSKSTWNKNPPWLLILNFLHWPIDRYVTWHSKQSPVACFCSTWHFYEYLLWKLTFLFNIAGIITKEKCLCIYFPKDFSPSVICKTHRLNMPNLWRGRKILNEMERKSF